MAGKEAANTNLHKTEDEQSFPLLSNSSHSSKLSLSLHGDHRELAADASDKQSHCQEAPNYPAPDSSEITSISTSLFSDTTDGGDCHRDINPRHWEYAGSSFSYNNQNSRTSLIGNATQIQSRGVSSTLGRGREYGAIPALSQGYAAQDRAIESTALNRQRRTQSVSAAQQRVSNIRGMHALSQSSGVIATAHSQGRECRTAPLSQSRQRRVAVSPYSHGVASTSQSHNVAYHVSIPQHSCGDDNTLHSWTRGEDGGVEPALQNQGREYGTVRQSQFVSENVVCPSNNLKKEQNVKFSGDRRNEFFTLKRFIFMTLGMPDTPAVTPKMQQISTCLAVPFYISLFVWGIAIFVVAIQSDGWIWTGKCLDVIPAKVLTMLAGTFFILLGLYWLYVLWWSKYSGTDALPLPHRSFSSIAILWWILCMYFFGIAAALATEVYENRHLVASLGNATSRAYPSMSVRCTGTEDYLEVPNNLVPLWALTSMVLLWVIYLGVFVIATISIYSVE